MLLYYGVWNTSQPSLTKLVLRKGEDTCAESQLDMQLVTSPSARMLANLPSELAGISSSVSFSCRQLIM